MISPRTIQAIHDATRIEDVVGEFVRLRRRGQNMLGLCPFHNERTPSFNVNPSRNIFKCFGCGESGDSIVFLTKHENMTYPEALRWLAGKYNIEIEEEKVTDEYLQQQQEQESLFLINEFALKYYQKQLWETDMGRSVGLGYFKDRGFGEDTIRHWGLGYAPESGDAFVNEAIRAGYKQDMLRRAGLMTQSGRDFFRGRVIFPIHSMAGKIAAFAGRMLGNDKTAGPKYLNTPETDIYHKSRILYGASFARNEMRKQDECLMVEGYTDVITLAQAGIKNVVASSGTALTVDQIGLVHRLTDNLTILYDGDAAGVKAALRGLDLVLEQDMNVRAVLLPNGEDPDSYLRRVGQAEFVDYVSVHKQDVILFKTGLLLEEAQDDPLKKAAMVRDIVGSIAKIPDAIKRAVFLKACGEKLAIDEQALVNELNKMIKANLDKKSSSASNAAAKREPPPPPQWPVHDAQPLPSDFPPDFPPDFGSPEFGMPDSGGFGDEPWVMDLPPMPPDDGYYQPVDPERPMVSPPQTGLKGDEFQEKDIVRLLMEFGDKQMSDGNTIGATLLLQLTELMEEFDNELYAEIVREGLAAIEENRVLANDYWLNHDRPVVAQLAMEFASTPWELSPNWERKDIYLSQKPPQDNFEKDLESGFKRFLLRKVRRMRRKNLDRLKKAEGDDLIIALRVDMKLSDWEKSLAKELGTVVF